MKKAIALLLALAAVCSISLTGFAAVDTTSGIGSYAQFAPGSTDAAPLLKVDENQIVLGLSTNGGTSVVLPETFLKPGNEYTFRIYRVKQDYLAEAPNAIDLEPITESTLNGAKLRLRTAKGSSNVTSAKIEKKGSGTNAYYQFVIETKETYGTKVNDLEYTISATGQANNANKLVDGSILFETGYRSMPDDDIDDYDEGDILTVWDDTPVITKKQFETLAKNANYKPVELEGEDGDWRFIGRVSGMTAANFTTTYDVVPDIVNLYPDQDYKFITFNAGITFPTSGELRLDVSDIVDSSTTGKIFTYLYRNGSLTPVNTTFDGTSDEIVFRTNYLGAFIVTDEELDSIDIDDEDDEDDDDINGGGSSTNPPTGAGSAMSVVTALGLVSLATAASISRKSKKK